MDPLSLPDAKTVEADLRRRVRGEVACDEVTRALYSTAACIYRVRPLGVVAPLDADDVVAAVRYCRARGIPVTARGAGSGLAGQTLGEGVVLDFTPHMNRILDVGDDHAWVQPGLVGDDLNAALEPRGTWFPPDPSSSGYCTLGGMIANNSAGSHSVRYGTTIDWVEELKVVLADGTPLHLKPYKLDGPAWQRLLADPSRGATLHTAVRGLVQANADLIREHQPQTAKNACGYRLERVVENGTLNLSRLVCGSEGTLAIVVAARVRLADLPGARRLALFHFADLPAAGRAILELLPLEPSAIELHEQHTIEVIRQARPELGDLLPEPGHSHLFVDFDGDTEEEVAAQIERARRRLVDDLGLAARVIEPASQQQTERLWAVRKATLPILYNRPGRQRVISFIEDVTVPVQHIPDYIDGLFAIFARHGVEAALYGHAAQGNFHTRPFLDLHDPAQVATMRAVADEVFDFTLRLGGTVSGEHGDGMARTEYLERVYGPLVGLFAQVKRLFDPDNLLNPGKKVPDPRRAYALTSHLRFDPDYGGRPMDERLAWDDGGMAAEAERCHGCATCRTLPASKTRMCPVFKALGVEEASPRAKANVLREIAAGRLDAQAAARELARVAETCLLCGSCKVDCPSKVDVPKLMLEAKAREAARAPRLWRALFARLDALSALAAPVAPLVNLANRFPPVRWLLHWLAHVDHRRPLPAMTRRTLHKRLRSRVRDSSHSPARSQVVYFPDVFAELNDPGIGEALVALLERAGIDVLVPSLKSCGILSMCYGNVEAARTTIRHNLDRLRAHVQDGLDILVTEPTALLCLRNEYADFVGDEAAEVAAHAHDALEYLGALHRDGRLALDLADLPLTLAHHTPCHARAAGLGRADLDLLGLVPGLVVAPIDEGCCGIAGSAGMRREKYDLSMRIGAALFARVRQPRFDGAVTTCSTCRMQIEHGADKPAYHPLHLLARSAFGTPLPRRLATGARRPPTK